MKAVFTTVLLVSGISLISTQAPTRLVLDLENYAALPITGAADGQNTMGQLARVNVLRDEPGGRRFFVVDLNGPLYILDKQTRQFATYLDFNGAAGRPGLFTRFVFEQNFATGLVNVIFDPDYANNGIFYTLHFEDPSRAGNAGPRAGVVDGLDLSEYQATASIAPTPDYAGPVEAEVVLTEWTDRDITNTTFEGTAREILRLQHVRRIHPLGEMTFNPTARPGDADWSVMYLGVGDSGAGDQRDAGRWRWPQRLDTLFGKIVRIIPDLDLHASTSSVSENGRYRIPDDNPFASVEGARKEIWAYGLRNPHRLIWDLAGPAAPRLLAFHIGLVTAETAVIVHRGANYGWPMREGTRAMSASGAGPIPEDDTLTVHVSDTVTRGTVTPTYPVLKYGHGRDENSGDAIAGGFIYTGDNLPALSGKLIFGDITTGYIWHANMAAVRAADDGDPHTLAPIHRVATNLRSLTEDAYRARGGRGAGLPGFGAVSGQGRVDVRFGVDNEGELYVLTKPDGMIRKIVGAREIATPAATGTRGEANVASLTEASPIPDPGATNPVPNTPASLARGKEVYDLHCTACHGPQAQGAARAGIAISIIEESGGKQPPDLTDAQWDHGSGDGAVFTVIKRGVSPTMMAGYEGRLTDQDIWHVVNYIRSLQR